MTTNGSLTTRDKFAAIRSSLRSTYIERDDAIECILLGALAQQHVLFLGPPGTGKSHLVTSLTRCVSGCDTFVTLLSKYTTEDELCGPAKLSALKLDRFERATAGHLPAAHVAFLDEVFKANAACLNATLSITNERQYKGSPVPLRFLVGASNELPQDESLGAMFDRFLLRTTVDYVKSETNWLTLLASEPVFTPPATIMLAEWDAAHAEARAISIGRSVLEELAKVRATLSQRGIVASDRRWVQALAVLRASAWLDGETEVTVDQLQALRFVLWHSPDQAAQVNAVLATLPQGPVRQAITIIDEALDQVAKNKPADPDEYARVIPALVQVCDAAAKRVRGFDKRLTKQGLERVNAAMKDLRQTREALRKDLDQRLGAAQ